MGLPRTVEPSVDDVMAVLATVRDPELPLSVVDLGLIYGVDVDQGRVSITMTFTSMGCPCHAMIDGDVRDAVSEMDGVESVSVDVVWDPPWTRARITPQGRRALGDWGIKS